MGRHDGPWTGKSVLKMWLKWRRKKSLAQIIANLTDASVVEAGSEESENAEN